MASNGKWKTTKYPGVYERKDKHGNKSWRAHVHRKGHKQDAKTFRATLGHTIDSAIDWKRENDSSITNRGKPLPIKALEKKFVREIVQRYLDEVTPRKGGAKDETTVLKRFLRHPICKKSLASISKTDAHEWVASRQKDKKRNGEPITLRTIARQRNVIRNIFNLAEERWGLTLPQGNPFTIDLSSYGRVKHRRRRRLKDGELERLIVNCKECRELNKFYLPLGIYLAIETGMRTDEMFDLTWQDVGLDISNRGLDMKNRRIEIGSSKTDRHTEYEGRTIVLTFYAGMYLQTIYDSVSREPTFKPSDLIFPMTKGAYGQSFRDAKKRAKITGLTFHDLRHEASSRFDEAELSKPQRDLMMGHNPKDVADGYPIPDLKRIQDKLDTFTLGKPLAEIIGGDGLIRAESRAQKELELFSRYLVDVGFIETRKQDAQSQALSNIIPFAASRK